MDNTIERAVTRAITTMRENLGEPLTVDDMARAAMFSKFHFTRIFQRVTGVSPGRFLSALRLQRAKHLLMSTPLSVADISFRVGYNSVGTFSTRFSRSVGMSPTTYRRMRGFTSHVPLEPPRGPDRASSRVYGHIWPTRAEARTVFIGLFPERITEGRPVRFAVLPGPGRYHLDNVPQGTWYLLAHSVAASPEELSRDPEAMDRAASVATYGPLPIHKDTSTLADLQLKPICALDPPVLMALVDASRLALAGTSGPGVTESNEARGQDEGRSTNSSTVTELATAA